MSLATSIQAELRWPTTKNSGALDLQCRGNRVLALNNGRLVRPDSPRASTQAQLQKAFPDGSQCVLDDADELTLLSLDARSNPNENVDYIKSTPKFFHGYRILEQTTVREQNKTRLLRAFYSGMADPTFAGACFSPDHGLCASRNGRSVDVVICFGSQQFVTYSAQRKGFSTISRAPRAIFNGVLTSSGVPLGYGAMG